LRERAPGGSKASKRACRPFTGELGLNELVDREGARKRIKPVGLATAGNRRPGSCVVRSHETCLVRIARQRAGASVKAIARSWSRAALAVVERELARKQGPARAGTAPRDGKALKGAPGTRAAWNKAAKRRVATANDVLCGGTSAGRGRAASKPEPSRGARTLWTAPARGWRPSPGSLRSPRRLRPLTGIVVGREGAPDVVAFEGARTPGEADPGSRTARRALARVASEKEHGRV
jgi:hypothetical protein